MLKILKITLCVFGLLLFCTNLALAEVNIAIISPLSKEAELNSQELRYGAKLAVEEINNKGGLLGKKINLVMVEDACDDALSVSSAEMMALVKDNSKMQMVIGPYCNNQSNKISTLYANAKIIQLLPLRVSKKDYVNSYNSLIKFCGFKEQQAKDIFAFLQQKYPQKTLAVIYDEALDTNLGIKEAVQVEFSNAKKDDFLVTFDYNSFPTTDKLLKALKEMNVGAVYVLGSADKVISLSQELQEEDANIAIFANIEDVKDKYQKFNNAIANGGYLLVPSSIGTNPNFAETLVNMRLIGEDFKGLTAYGYLSVKFWEDAVIRANSFDYNKVSNAMNNCPIQTGWENVEFVEGNPNKSMGYNIFYYDKDEYTQVY